MVNLTMVLVLLYQRRLAEVQQVSTALSNRRLSCCLRCNSALWFATCDYLIT